MKEHELFKISMQECRKANWLSRLTLGPQLALPWRTGEGRKWPAREGWHDSPVMWGGWSGWTTSSHSTSRHGEVKTAGGLPAKVGTTCFSYGTW
ncbi:hypothetical protein CRG98_017078 [Punica granatum]|uniref:Uncharacterized protein n=1 Tax=Punica granatum TaxID=22663 RepID=A0A2I0K1W4_PUNGR|nr:hypothetical protein CRG98_017078 [Punica granatum]